MYTLNIFPGISQFELLHLLSRARRDSALDSLRLVGLHPEDVTLVKSSLLLFLSERPLQEEHHWNSLLLFWLVPSEELEDLINDILGLNIFRSVYFKCPNQTSPLPPYTLTSLSLPPTILSAALSSSSIEKITFCNAQMSVDSARLLRDEVKRRHHDGTLARGSFNTGETLAKRQPRLHALEFVTCSFEKGAFLFLCSALQALSALDTLKFWYSELSYSDLIHILRCLQGHPSLTRLDWMERNTWNLTSEARDVDDNVSRTDEASLEDVFDRMLSSKNCQVRVLGLSVGSMSMVGTLFSRLSRNTSIEWLDLSYNGNDVSSTNPLAEEQVFGNLHKFQNLHSVDLFCTRLSSTAFESLTARPVPSLEHISCWGDDLWEGTPSNHVTTVLKILETHPNFVEFYGGLHWRTAQVQFLFDTRKVYRHEDRAVSQEHRKKGEEEVAPSLWPLILERANRLLASDQRRSRTLYWLLQQGPAFSVLPLNYEI